MKTKKYNGWTNYETWLCALWMGENQDYWFDIAHSCMESSSDDETTTEAIADAIKEHMETDAEKQIREYGFFRDLINASLSEINYYEVAKEYLGEAKEE